MNMNREIIEAAHNCSGGECSIYCPLFGYVSCERKFREAIVEHHNKYRWHDLREDPNDLPQNEEVVEIAFVNPYTGKYWTARAFYEDGTMHSEDSIFGGDLWEWCEYDENTDDYILSAGWFEHVMFGEWYTEINGKFVIAWREIEPYRPADHCPNDYHGGDC